MTRIVILGGGFGGLTVFHHLKKLMADQAVAITVVDERESFLVKPSLPEVALGEKDISDVIFSLQPVIEPFGKFICSRVQKIDPKAQVVFLAEGSSVAYDYLVIAIGAKKEFESTPGFMQFGHSVCTDTMAPRLHEAIERFESGNILIGSAPMRSGSRVKDAPHLATACEGPVGEMAFMLDSALRKRGIRDQTRIICFTPAEVFFEDVGDNVHEAFGVLAQAHGVEVITQKTITSIEKDQVVFADDSVLSSSLTVLIPTYSGPDLIVDSGLGDEAGFVPTDKDFQHLDYPNIYAVGDIASRTVPKLGHLAVEQGSLVASILHQRLTGNGERYDYDPEVFCIMNMGHHQATLIRSNVLWGGTMDIAYHSTLSHLMKSALDSYMVKFKGKMPPQMAQKLLDEYLEKFVAK